jgi:aminobenzoyl-glutamate utilization protein B
MKYQPLIRPDDKPAIELNTGIMARYRPAQSRFYYDATRHKSYLEQLGVAYPTVRRPDGVCPAPTPSATSAR